MQRKGGQIKDKIPHGRRQLQTNRKGMQVCCVLVYVI